MGGSLRLLTVAAASVVATVAAYAQPLPQAVPLDTWGPPGTVSAVARQGDTLYVGGSFDYVGPSTGPFAAFDVDSAEPGVVASGFDGSLRAIVALPGGGWIVAGQIRRPAGGFAQVARLDAQGQIDPAWFADVSGFVESLATDGTRIFLGGSFASLNGQTRTGLAAVDAATGAVLPWNPVLVEATSSPSVSTMLAHQGALYVAGRFASVNGDARAGFAAVDGSTAATLPTVLAGLASVDTLAALGDTLYLGGRFPTFLDGGVALSIATGQLLPWTTSYSASRGLVATATRVFAASFDAVRALDPVTGALIGPPLVSSAFVRAIGAGDGVLAVAMNAFGTAPQNRVATFDAATGQPRSWSVSANQSIDAIAVRDGGLAVGGSFVSAGGVARRNLFALDLRTGRPTPFSPDVEGQVFALAMVGNVLVLGGSIYRVNGQDQRVLAALTADTGALLPWAPMRDGFVHGLAFVDDTLFVGGDFRIVDGHSRPNLAAIQVPTGTVTSWLPVPDRPVRALAVGGDALVVGGEFTALAGGPRGSGAAFSARGGVVSTWDPGANAAIMSVAVGANDIALAGSFDTVHAQARPNFALVDRNGAPLSLPLPFSTYGARAVTRLDDQIIVGGRFNHAGQTRTLFAASIGSGLLEWNPVLEEEFSFPDVTVLARYPDLLIAAGRFHAAGGRRVLNLAVFPSEGAGPPRSMRARVAGSLATVGWSAPAGTAPSSFVVEVGTAAGASDVGRFSVASTTISGALPAGTFFVRVRAVVGGVEGQASSEIVLTSPSAPLPPSAPAGLVASVSGAIVSLSWMSAPGNAESYVIDAGSSPGQSNLASFDTGTLDTTFAAAVFPGTYYVRIRARNAFGSSPASNEVAIVVP